MKKNNLIFMIAIGFFLIALSPLWGNKYLNIITGLSFVAVGYYFLKKKT